MLDSNVCGILEHSVLSNMMHGQYKSHSSGRFVQTSNTSSHQSSTFVLVYHPLKHLDVDQLVVFQPYKINGLLTLLFKENKIKLL